MQTLAQQPAATQTASNQPSLPDRSLFGHNHSGRSSRPLNIQPKLTVSSPGDRYEREADQVADAVMAGRNVAPGQVSQGIQRNLYRVEIRPEDMVDSMPPESVPAIGEPLGGV